MIDSMDLEELSVPVTPIEISELLCNAGLSEEFRRIIRRTAFQLNLDDHEPTKLDFLTDEQNKEFISLIEELRSHEGTALVLLADNEIKKVLILSFIFVLIGLTGKNKCSLVIRCLRYYEWL